MSPAAAFTSDDLARLLDELARRLDERRVHGRLLLVGGAAMSMGHGASRLTRDVDADFEPSEVVREVAIEIAHERGLREDWLNAKAAAFLPRMSPEDRVLLATRPGLTIEIASPRVLLAMKMAAFRAVDLHDLEVLFTELCITDPREAVRITRELYGEHSGVLRDDADDDLHLQAEEILDRLSRRSG